jgi:endonuclease III
MAPHGDPLGELVLTVLSQSTNDRNRDVAFLRLRRRFDAWEAVRDAPVEEVEEAIRPGGISKVKSVRIQDILRAAGDPLDLSWMRSAPVAESRDHLTGLPGVGRKTAACVLLFAYGLRDVPVDTHVGRVGTRLALLRPGSPVRGAARRDAGADAARRRARVPREHAAPRAPDVPRAAPGVRRVRAAADVPGAAGVGPGPGRCGAYHRPP